MHTTVAHEIGILGYLYFGNLELVVGSSEVCSVLGLCGFCNFEKKVLVSEKNISAPIPILWADTVTDTEFWSHTTLHLIQNDPMVKRLSASFYRTILWLLKFLILSISNKLEGK